MVSKAPRQFSEKRLQVFLGSFYFKPIKLTKSLSHVKTNLTVHKYRQKMTRASKSAIQGVLNGLCLNLYFLLTERRF